MKLIVAVLFLAFTLPLAYANNRNTSTDEFKNKERFEWVIPYKITVFNQDTHWGELRFKVFSPEANLFCPHPDGRANTIIEYNATSLFLQDSKKNKYPVSIPYRSDVAKIKDLTFECNYRRPYDVRLQRLIHVKPTKTEGPYRNGRWDFRIISFNLELMMTGISFEKALNSQLPNHLVSFDTALANKKITVIKQFALRDDLGRSKTFSSCTGGGGNTINGFSFNGIPAQIKLYNCTAPQ